MQDIPVEKVIEILQRASDWHKVNHSHGARVSKMAIKIGERLGLVGEELQHLRYTAGLHDIGRIGVDDSVMSKISELTDSQRGAIQKHPAIGYNLIKDAFPSDIAEGVLYHQEHWDGSGYPSSLKAEQIPLFSRVVCVCDVWDAITNDRPYRKAMAFGDALEEMKRVSSWFDPQVYALFLQIVRADD